MSKTYISLFSSAGVGCYGFKQNGFECVATNELIKRRLDVQKYNNKCKYKSGYICGSIQDEDVKTKLYAELEKWKAKNKTEEIDVLVSTPPCQGISLINHKKSDTEIVRNSLVVESISHVLNIKPKFFIFENVLRFMKTQCTDFDKKERTIEEVIYNRLGKFYNIHHKVINFKDYGANSSRRRTLVIGVRKDLKNIDPKSLFPDKQSPKMLKEIIGDLPRLEKMGKIDPKDIYHSFRNYDLRMYPWIQNTPYGESAFDNPEDTHKPHRKIDGEIVFNKNKTGDKYKRQDWGKVAPCIHTRNDILASQNTVHPEDNRVFSIRELMIMMNIPKEFKWVSEDERNLNKMTIKQKQEFLKKNEINIRQSIGEAVPTIIFNKIAKKIGDILDGKDY